MKKRIAIFNDFQLPVPAIRGGAVQQLTTALLDCNEADYRYEFEVYTPYDEKAVEASKKYKCKPSHIIQNCKGEIKSCSKLQDGTKLKWEYLKED